MTRSAPWRLRSVVLSVAACGLLALACTATAPRNIDDSCAMFREKPYWYRATKRSHQRWGVPIAVQLAIVHQESRFQPTARPRRTRILGFLPGPRPSSAYGYTQAVTETWDEYVRATGNRGADRDDFSDAVDFVGWYTARTAQQTGLSKSDAYNLYLAYHEGNGGFRRRTYRSKPWLIRAARKVQSRASLYGRQLASCRDSLDKPWWRRLHF